MSRQCDNIQTLSWEPGGNYCKSDLSCEYSNALVSLETINNRLEELGDVTATLTHTTSWQVCVCVCDISESVHSLTHSLTHPKPKPITTKETSHFFHKKTVIKSSNVHLMNDAGQQRPIPSGNMDVITWHLFSGWR